jgi:hypothetical protein
MKISELLENQATGPSFNDDDFYFLDAQAGTAQYAGRSGAVRRGMDPSSDPYFRTMIKDAATQRVERGMRAKSLQHRGGQFLPPNSPPGEGEAFKLIP